MFSVSDVTVIAKSCPPLHCPLACKNGYAKDESECHICKCIGKLFLIDFIELLVFILSQLLVPSFLYYF